MRQKKTAAADPLEQSLFNEDRTRLTKAGAEALQRWYTQMREPFSTEGQQHATWVDGDHPFAVFDEFFARRPDAVQIADGLASDVFKFERTGTIEGREPYPWQVGALRWSVFSLLQGGSSYLIEGGPGAGKTFVLGRAVHNAVRAQIAGVMDRVVTIVFNKPFTAEQQVLDVRDRSERAATIDALRKDELRHIVAYCASVLPSSLAQVFTIKECSAIIQATLDTTAAYERVRLLCGSEEVDPSILTTLSYIFGGTARVIDDYVKGRQSVLRFSKHVDDDPAAPDASLFSGDILRGVPPEYLQSGKVASTIRGLDIGRSIDDISTEGLAQIRVLLTTQGTLDRQHPGAKIAYLLAKTGVVVVDDSRRGARLFQEAKGLELRGKTPPPLVIMASALSETNGDKARPSADRVSPKILSSELLGTIAQDVGTDVVPRDASATLYHSTSRETLDRAVTLHFESPPILDCYPDHPKPFECDTIIVVNAKVTDAYVARFRAEYEKRGIPAQVEPLMVGHCPQKQRISRTHAMFAWMANKNQALGPRILVIPDHAYRDAVSLPAENVLIATGLSDQKSGRIAGRLSHVRPTGEEGRRSMLRQVLTSDSSASLHDVFPLEDTFVPLAVALGKKGAARDKKKAMGLPSFPVLTSRVRMKMKKELGTSLIDDDYGVIESAKENGNPMVAFTEACAALQLEKPLKTEWKIPKVRADFQELLLETLWPHFRRIRSINYERWELQLNLQLYQSSHSPEGMLEAARIFYAEFVRTKQLKDNGPAKKRSSPSIIASKDVANAEESVAEAFDEVPEYQGDDPYGDVLDTFNL